MSKTLVVVDGLSGIGKDTFIEHLRVRLENELSIPIILEKEPTNSFYGERAILRFKKNLNDYETMMLMLLDRYIHVEKIKSSAPDECIIIMNRYGLSTLVYQDQKFSDIIINSHKFFTIPDVTIILDANHQRWFECNRDGFFQDKIENKNNDRGSFRNKLKAEHVYNSVREKYLEQYPLYMTGRVKILEAFRDTREMTDDVIDLISNIHNGGHVQRGVIDAKLLANEINRVEADGASNKVVMDEVEKCIKYLLETVQTFTTEEVILSLKKYDVKRVIGNVIKKLLRRGYIKYDTIDISFRKIDHRYIRGDHYFNWQ